MARNIDDLVEYVPIEGQMLRLCVMQSSSSCLFQQIMQQKIRTSEDLQLHLAWTVKSKANLLVWLGYNLMMHVKSNSEHYELMQLGVMLF